LLSARLLFAHEGEGRKGEREREREREREKRKERREDKNALATIIEQHLPEGGEMESSP